MQTTPEEGIDIPLERMKTRHDGQVTSSVPSNSKKIHPPKFPKEWIFRIIALLGVPAVILLAIEILLRLAELGYNPRFIIKTKVNGESFYASNPRAGWRFLGPKLAREPFPFCVPARKDPNKTRILVLGESAAFGDPHPHVGLSRMIEAILNLRYGHTNFEVINAALTGINTHAIRQIARDCTALKADIWVLYIGNNEVIGPYGPGTVFTRKTPPLWVIRLSSWAKSLRIGQVLENAFLWLRPTPSTPNEWLGLTMFAEQKLHPHDPRLENVHEWFEKNLQDIIETGLDSGAIVVACTVGVNLRDCPPFASLHKPVLSSTQLTSWNELYEKGRTAEANGMWQDALRAYQAAASIDDTYAELRYRQARCALALGNTNLAFQEFVAACDLDALRLRCTSAFNDIIKRVATRFPAGKVHLVDVMAVLCNASENRIPGANFFYEHVHLNFEGIYHAALAICQTIEPLLSQGSLKNPTIRPWPTIEECEKRLAWTDLDRISAWSEIMLRISDPPFVWQCNNSEQRELLKASIQAKASRGHDAILSDALARTQNAIREWPFDAVLHQRASTILATVGQYPQALHHLQQYVNAIPVAPEGWRLLSTLQLRLNHVPEALEAARTAVKLNDRDVWSLRVLAHSQLRAGQTNAAIQTLQHATKVTPVFGPAWLDLAQIYESLGQSNLAAQMYQAALTNRVLRPAELIQLARVCMSKGWIAHAIKNYTDAIILHPSDPQLRIETAQALIKAGQTYAAISNLQYAILLEPRSVVARYLLGLEYGKLGDHAKAAEQFSVVVKLMPDMQEGHLNLGIAMMKLGNYPEALKVFESVLARWPTNQIAIKYAETLRAFHSTNNSTR